MNVRHSARALLAIVALAATPAAAGPLAEIGRTSHDTPICGNLVVHANAAIAAIVRGDDAIGRAAAHLRSGDLGLDDASTPRRQAVAELRRSTAVLGETTARAGEELKRFDAYAVSSDVEAQRVEMREFSHALALVLDRQRRTADDLDAFVSQLALHDYRADAARPDPVSFRTDRPGPRPATSLATTTSFERDESPDLAGRRLASLLDTRVTATATNEARANELGEIAVGGC